MLLLLQGKSILGIVEILIEIIIVCFVLFRVTDFLCIFFDYQIGQIEDSIYY